MLSEEVRRHGEADLSQNDLDEFFELVGTAVRVVGYKGKIDKDPVGFFYAPYIPKTKVQVIRKGKWEEVNLNE